MGVKSQLFLVKVYLALAMMSIAVSVISAAQDHDVPVSVDGIKCDSCGSECSAMCGSRSFRTCCYNYIKKRSIPWSAPSATSNNEGHDSPTENKQLNSINSDFKSSPVKTPILLNGAAAKQYLKGHLSEIPDSIEEAELIYPLSLRDWINSFVRNLNAFENKKIARALLY